MLLNGVIFNRLGAASEPKQFYSHMTPGTAAPASRSLLSSILSVEVDAAIDVDHFAGHIT
jgi:hypothetical protein